MGTPAVDSGSSTTNTSTTNTTGSSSVLDKDSFLKLLVAQLTNQDPTSPMDTSQFVSQMATFTTLEQTQNMSDAIDKLVQTQSDQSFSEQASLIGKQIQWDKTDTDDDGNEKTTSMTGIVKAVSMKDGSVSYLTEDGNEVDPSSITKISEAEEG